MIPLQPSLRADPVSRGHQGAPQPKAPDHERQPLLLIFLQSSRLESSPRFRRTVQSSNGRPHLASTVRQLAQSPQTEGETDTKSEPQIRERGQCVVGPPGVGKSHLGSAIGLALVEKGYRVLFCRTTDLVQKLQQARRDLELESAISKLDKFHLLVLDDITYVTKDQAETSVLFELISARYERRSMLITANQPFGEWNTIFPDPAMTLAAVDRLVHHATIFEMNVESYRRRAAEKAKERGRSAQQAMNANVKAD